MRNDRKLIAILFLILVAGGLGFLLITPTHAPAPTQGVCSIQLQGRIPLPNTSGRIDHIDLDSSKQILFVAALGNNSVSLVDVTKGMFLGSVIGLRGPQGVAFVKPYQRVYISNVGDGTVYVYNETSLSRPVVIQLPASSGADNMRVSPDSRRLFVGYGSGGIASIDTISDRILWSTALIGHPESFQFDSSSNRIYANVPAGNYVVVLDSTNGTIISRWPILGATGNYAMAIDEVHARLFVATRSPNEMFVIDTATGETVATFPLSSDSDDIFLDSGTGCIYVSAGEGLVDVIKQVNPDTYSVLTHAATSPGARTSLFDPLSKRLFVADPGSNHQGYIWVYSTR